MLVLTRKKNETILLGPNNENVLVRVTVVDIRGSQVRLWIKAPRHMQILCAETADALQNQVENPALVVSQGSARSEAGAGAKQYPLGGTAPEIKTDSKAGVVFSRKVNEAISIGKARLTVVQIRGVHVRLGIEFPNDWFYCREEIEETRLLLAINECVSVELTDRAESLIEKRDECSLTVEENSELLQLADEVERRGVERLEALSKLAELRGVSLRELMQSLGVAAADHG